MSIPDGSLARVVWTSRHGVWVGRREEGQKCVVLGGSSHPDHKTLEDLEVGLDTLVVVIEYTEESEEYCEKGAGHYTVLYDGKLYWLNAAELEVCDAPE